MEPYNSGPTYAEVRATRAILKSFNLPTELVLEILDRARYWPVFSYAGRRVTVDDSQARVCLYANVWGEKVVDKVGGHETGETPKVKDVEFSISSRDQGWTSDTRGTYNITSSLEVSILHRSCPSDSISAKDIVPIVQSAMQIGIGHPEALQDRLKECGWTFIERPDSAERYPQGGQNMAWYLQGNRVATRRFQASTVIWRRDTSIGNEGSGSGEGFVRELKEGDIVVIWARAKYLGWMCDFERINMTVRFGY